MHNNGADSPICSIEELISWNSRKPGRNVASLRKVSYFTDDCTHIHKTDIPKVIYCHDMANGYHQYDTSHAISKQCPTFRFIHWDLIDIFVYFSHHLITIPPTSWINVAHRNNVSVYGTFLFEHWCATSNELFKNVFCVKQSKSNFDYYDYTFVAHALNRIRLEGNFEGWLINIECPFPSGSERTCLHQIKQFLRLMKCLGSEIIWYDAVTISGKLNWQNALTDQNYEFFREADGIMLNYGWNSQLLKSSQYMAESADESRGIFVGVDCFGRGCPGGGGFNTNVALQLILDANTANPARPLSVALFAPAWCFEHFQRQPTTRAPPQDVLPVVSSARRLADIDHLFWFLIRRPLEQIRSISGLPLRRPFMPHLEESSHFAVSSHCCLAQGISRVQTGATGRSILPVGPWSDLYSQQVLPSFRVISFSPYFERIHNETGLFNYRRLVNHDMPPLRNRSEVTFRALSTLESCIGSNSGSCMCIEAWVPPRLRGSSHTDYASPGFSRPARCHMELFSLGNLLPSQRALLVVACSPIQPPLDMRLFVDLLIAETNERAVFESAAATHRQYLTVENTLVSVDKKAWSFMRADIGKQLSGDKSEIIYLRRIGLEFTSNPFQTFLIGEFNFSDPDAKQY